MKKNKEIQELKNVKTKKGIKGLKEGKIFRLYVEDQMKKQTAAEFENRK